MTSLLSEPLPVAAPGPAGERGGLTLRVRGVAWECEGVCSYELVDPEGLALPPFEAGAHLDLHIDGVGVRQYSLCNDPAERTRYVLAVQRDDQGRGGSLAVHERVRAGGLLRVSLPRNHFALDLRATAFLLIAGGIGITPVLAMARTLVRLGRPFRLVVCTRSRARTPFYAELQQLARHGDVRFVHDGGDPARGLDLAELLAQPRPGEHLYCCGPAALMDEVARRGVGWEALRFERFRPASPTAPPGEPMAEGAFTVQIRSTGQRLAVPANQSVLECLRAAGLAVESSCELGICGTCAVGVVSGRPEHRDDVLDASQRASNQWMMACVSRAADGDCLVLDL